MRFVGPVLLLIAGVVLGWIALAAEEPTFHAARPRKAPETIPYEVATPVPAGFELQDFQVEGICCAGCAGKLYLAATDLQEVREVAVDPIGEQVHVVVRAGTDPHRLSRALTFDKYTAHPVP